MTSSIRSKVYWVQPRALRRYFELRDGEKTLASVQWDSIFSSDAECTAGQKHWTLKRKGFFKPYTVVIDTDTGDEIAEFRSGWGGKGNLSFSDGRMFRWKHEGVLHSRWFLTTEDGDLLACFYAPPGFKAQAAMDVYERLDDGALPLLAIIGWYTLYIIWSSASS